MCQDDRKLAGMRSAGWIARGCLDVLGGLLGPGVNGVELNRQAERFITGRGARPAFKNYRGYPAAICVSANEVVIHGIPGDVPFREGDIVSIDLGVEKNGYFADVAATFPVGVISREKKRLLETARSALEGAVARARAGAVIDEIGACIEQAAEKAGFSVVKVYCGHGIGTSLHEKPEIPNYRCGDRTRLHEGLALAIEPMVNYSTCDVRVLADGWTVVTADGGPSAHFEETVFVTSGGPEVMTRL